MTLNFPPSPDVAFLLVGVLNRDDWNAGHVLSIDQFGVIIPRKDVRTLPTSSGSLDLIEARMTFLRRTTDWTGIHMISLDLAL